MPGDLLGPPDTDGLDAALTKDLPFLALPNQTLAPGLGDALYLSSAAARAVAASVVPGDVILTGLMRDATRPMGDKNDLWDVGVAARVVACEAVRPDAGDGGDVILTVEGMARVRIDVWHASASSSTPYATGRAHRIDVIHHEHETTSSDVTASATNAASSDADAKTVAELRDVARRVLAAMPHVPAEMTDLVDRLAPERLIDLVGANLNLDVDDKAHLLTAASTNERGRMTIERLRAYLRRLERLSELNGRPLKQVWVLDDDARSKRTAAVDAGHVTTDEARELETFARQGYVVFEGAIEPELVDELVADVRSIQRHPGAFITTDHRRGRGFRLSDETFDSFESIFDLYVNFASARRVCLHPRILRFLEIVFEEAPVAFQQLLFQRSNLHSLHQDTAYVCVEDPLLLVASWVALEDVVPGRGELTYFEGSHRIPHQFFSDGSKRFDGSRDDEEASRRYLAEACAAAGSVQKDFHAKKGDVLLWAADLVHGSRPRTRPEHETRLSCVTHYCPKSSDPLWAWDHPQHATLHPWGDRSFIASSHYRGFGGEAYHRPTPHVPLTV